MRKKRFLLPALPVLLASVGLSHAMLTDMPLRHSIGVADVSGGDKANPHWESGIGNDEFRRALESSLNLAGLLERAKGEGSYSLSAALESIESPSVGLSITVTARVRYTLTERASGRQVFQECVYGQYTIETWDSLWRPRRLQVAAKGAAQESTRELSRKLMSLSVGLEGVTLAQ